MSEMRTPEGGVTGTAPIDLPTPHGTFEARAWRGHDGEHMSLLARGSAWPGEGSDASQPPLVRVHSECATGDIFGSYRCDCGEQLDGALEAIQREGGAVIYMRGHEGRGIGLFEKIRAYHLQDLGDDTVEANVHLGLPVDARRYDDAANILRVLGFERVRLMTNNPEKDGALASLGIEVAEIVPSEIAPREANRRYLETKREKMAHRLNLESSITTLKE
ncbi:GTP cyclohydrolase II [Dermabacter vaginalis]|nr:GTP cyclohydrolase II [Dermabacter vaginalis]